MWAARNNSYQTAAVSFDAKKVFDCVNLPYLFATLKSFGVGQIFVN